MARTWHVLVALKVMTMVTFGQATRAWKLQRMERGLSAAPAISIPSFNLADSKSGQPATELNRGKAYIFSWSNFTLGREVSLDSDAHDV
jgi:hypothetical protein